MSTTIVDSHCHIHSQDTLQECLRAIDDLPPHIDALICVIELKQSNWFSKLVESDLPNLQHISAVAARFDRGETAKVMLVRGEQVNTAEKLEVIIMGAAEAVPEGLPMFEYIERYAADQLVVIPWGVGKWLGPRGSIVKQMVESRAPIALGDNGGRPAWWSVSHFAQANSVGIPVLRGSDPLPVSSYATRTLAYADKVNATFESEQEWIDFVKKRGEHQNGYREEMYGGLRNTMGFIADQLALRMS